MQQGYEVYAFLPLGISRHEAGLSASIGMRPSEVVRVGLRKFVRGRRFDQAFTGLNKPHRVLVHVEVQTIEAAKVTTRLLVEILLGLRHYGPAVFEGMQSFAPGTFRVASYGRSWLKCNMGFESVKMLTRRVQRYMVKSTVVFRPPGEASSSLYPLLGA